MAQNTSLDLAQYRDRNRLIVLSAPSAQDTAYQQMQQELKMYQSGVAERDLIVLHLLDHDQSYVGDQPISTADVQAVRDRFGITSGSFVFLLVGKDGTMKRQEHTAVALSDVFAQIDQMPMRQHELRERGRHASA